VSGQAKGQTESPANFVVVSVKLPREVREAVRSKAEANCRSLSGHLRWLAERDLEAA
jgi:hypothetical protein